MKNMESLTGIRARARRCELPNISNGSAGFWSIISGENSPESRCSKGRLKKQAQPQPDRKFLRGPNFLKVLEYWGSVWCVGMEHRSGELDTSTGRQHRAQRCELPNISNGSAGFWSMISGENSPESRCSKGRLKNKPSPSRIGSSCEELRILRLHPGGCWKVMSAGKQARSSR